MNAVFNFDTGMHNVAEVTKADYDACSSTNPISVSTTGPTTTTLTSPGQHFFICSVGPHCSFGQRLSINVSSSASSSAAATPPTPSPAPVSAPLAGSETYIVGEEMGWVVPPAGAVAYQTWVLNKTFLVGDTLVFNFFDGAHNVAEVSREEYRSCNSTTAAAITNSPARITLTTTGPHFFICTVPTHCSRGQQLAINVSTSTITTPPSSTSSTSPPSPAAQPPPSDAISVLAVTALPLTILSITMALLF